MFWFRLGTRGFPKVFESFFYYFFLHVLYYIEFLRAAISSEEIDNSTSKATGQLTIQEIFEKQIT